MTDYKAPRLAALLSCHGLYFMVTLVVFVYQVFVSVFIELVGCLILLSLAFVRFRSSPFFRLLIVDEDAVFFVICISDLHGSIEKFSWFPCGVE